MLKITSDVDNYSFLITVQPEGEQRYGSKRPLISKNLDILLAPTDVVTFGDPALRRI